MCILPQLKKERENRKKQRKGSLAHRMGWVLLTAESETQRGIQLHENAIFAFVNRTLCLDDSTSIYTVKVYHKQILVL